ncbi:MAG TPA: heterodisulfide reductase subunit F [Chlorobaculum sp.]|uniref:Hydrogenase/sulfur reductase, gamma subunit n=1 Tax=Chlorobaculum tepidum (strain ATCC 49652 / DSM 12025 / NBRC 103806 / TLS) TaxID=194439 RepID=Q8KD07_CHLTE|nr:FAD/NAD(P)-binding protein [Chlorobaculum tepidum]AAM72480.1 hydrogenase/sulfur reductase, gamma subunit [Chlorobaculum tepidum TLS]HBU23561.1 heterodisulfide reductase subunit F [Chlorobaculum sp.]
MIYSPFPMRVVSKRAEAPGVNTLKLEFVKQEDHEFFKANYRTGMFGLYGVFGEGESTFCVASPETRKEYIECTFRQSGRVTSTLANTDAGDIVTFRGPYGNRFPIEEFEGKNLLFIAGGIALPPTRSVIWSCLDQREKYRDVTIVYGARTVADLVYKNELDEWKQRDDVRLVLTVDPGGETPDWQDHVGFVPTVLEQAAPSPENTIAVLCGPPIMIKFTLTALEKLGFTAENVYTTLENRMKCGIGKCGRCNVGSIYICKEGPVFTAAEVQAMPQADL